MSVFDIVINFIEAYLLAFLSNALLTKKEQRSILNVYVLGAILSLVTTMSNYVSTFTPLQGFIINIIIILFALYYSCDSLVYKITVAFFPLMLLDICNIIIIVLFMISQHYEISYLLMNGYYIPIVLFSKLLFLLMTICVWLLKKWDSFNVSRYIDNSWWTVILVVFFFSIIDNLIFSVLFTGEIQFYEILVIFFSLIIMMISMFFLLKSIVKANQEKYVVELNLQILKSKIEQYKKDEEVNDKIQTKMHDLKHTYAMINEFLIEKAYDELKSMVERESRIVYSDFYCATNNTIVNMVLKEKIAEAKVKNINIMTDIKLPKQLKTKDEELYRMCANLLDNAIENCDLNNPCVEVYIEMKQDYVCIKIINSICDAVIEKNPNLKTSKLDKFNHGYGIKSVKEIIKKYNGTINYVEKDKMLSCIVVFEDK